ncbi:MAG TPA: hypothetical protein VGJ93_00075 [Desulfuromonadaceae bacterium]|jgi:hypothetical protein
MFLLPKGPPLAEKVPIAKINLPLALNKLRASNFTGYAHLSFTSAESVLLYDEGRLISALFQRDKGCFHDMDAIRATIEFMAFNREGTFSVFRLHADIVVGLLALISGEAVISSQQIVLTDFKSVLNKIKEERLNASLVVYTDVHTGVVFYIEGNPVGFFHDEDLQIGSSPVDIQKIAGYSDAKIDLKTIKGDHVITLADLNGLIDIEKTWVAVTNNIFFTDDTPTPTPVIQTIRAGQTTSGTANKVKLETLLVEIAVTHLGKLGRTLAEKELANIGDVKSGLVPENIEIFLLGLEKGAKLLTSSSKIREMKDSIRTAIAQYS